MSYTTKKVFDAIHPRKESADNATFDAMAGLMEFNNCGNDSYHDWTVDDEHAGGGYVSKEEQTLINKWLKVKGAEVGENILIYYWW